MSRYFEISAMDLPLNPSALLAIFFFLILFHKYIIYPILLSPLAKIPNAHPTAGLSSAWILWIRYSCKEIQTIHKVHQRLGPVVRLGPKEISVNCVTGGIQTVYSGGFEKHEWYANLFDNYGTPNMFSTSESRPHSIRKRMLSNVYSKSFLQSSPTLSGISRVLLCERFLPTLIDHADQSIALNIYALFSAITMDFVTSYQFGLSGGANLLRDKKFCKHFLGLYGSRQSYNYYPQELPRLTKFLEILGVRLVPRWVDKANQEIEQWTLGMCRSAADYLHNHGSGSPGKVSDNPVVYSQVQNAMAKNEAKSGRDGDSVSSQNHELTIASEMLDHLAAGFDTSGITLTYVIHEMSQRPELQATLREELRALDQPLKYLGPLSSEKLEIPTAKALDALPLLQSILLETLRLHAAIPGSEPRITPASGCRIGPNGEYQVPGGIRISAQAWSLHRNPEVYKAPEEWKPDRWMKSDPEELREMNRWFWAFGSGGRMCVGSNLAIYQMKYILASIYTNFTTIIVDDDGIEQKDLYTAGPKGGKLIIRVEVAP